MSILNSVELSIRGSSEANFINTPASTYILLGFRMLPRDGRLMTINCLFRRTTFPAIMIIAPNLNFAQEYSDSFFTLLEYITQN